MQLFQLVGKKAVRTKETNHYHDGSYQDNDYLIVTGVNCVEIEFTDYNGNHGEFHYSYKPDIMHMDDNWEEYGKQEIVFDEWGYVKVTINKENEKPELIIENNVLTFSDALKLAEFIDKHCKE